MADRPWSEIIKGHPIGTSLRDVHHDFNSICQRRGISPTPDGLDQLDSGDHETLKSTLILTLQFHPLAKRLPSKTNHGSLKDDLNELFAQNLEFERIRPLLYAVLTHKPDSEIWDQTYNAVIESTPHPWTTLPLSRRRSIHSRSWFIDSSEHLKYMDGVLKKEIGHVYVGLRDFHEAYFGGVPGLKAASEAFFEQCVKASNPFFDNGWRGWPKDVNQDSVLSWLSNFVEKLVTFVAKHEPFSTCHRRLLAKHIEPGLDLMTMTQPMTDIGFVNNHRAAKSKAGHLWKILVPGEVKSNSNDDRASKTWIDLANDARTSFYAQETRRFVLGFTICGSLMRIWEFDRLGGIASDQFDINVDGLRFISTILGFLLMNEEQLGFDPTIITSKSGRSIEIERNGSKERLIIDEQMMQRCYIAGRATTCFKAHREGDAKTRLIIKDSWQSTQREQEGELLQEATGKGVVNVARYYYHETVRVSGKEDDIRDNIRKRIDVTKAVDYQTGLSGMAANICLELLPNRVHRRVIIRDYGKEICTASSAVVLLTALEGCIEGHESLYKAGVLHRDIAMENLMINEDCTNPSWPSFLIDLDLAIRREPREGVSKANTAAGTRQFMAIGALMGEQHSFMHDLESFFWVLLWICVNYEGPDWEEYDSSYDKWKHMGLNELARIKRDLIDNERWFLKNINIKFSEYYSALVPWVNELRRVVFPNDKPWETEDESLYSSMKKILRDAREDPNVKSIGSKR